MIAKKADSIHLILGLVRSVSVIMSRPHLSMSIYVSPSFSFYSRRLLSHASRYEEVHLRALHSIIRPPNTSASQHRMAQTLIKVLEHTTSTLNFTRIL